MLRFAMRSTRSPCPATLRSAASRSSTPAADNVSDAFRPVTGKRYYAQQPQT